ncbi:MAG: type II toxin-antitoxin system HicA family toxin [Bryobacterales bacterium]|nr:type II toxin-antitoxin system HicA family toxin [Bryobacterales bacterium]
MGRLRTLSGDAVVAILREFDFVPVSQRGSHMKLRRVMGQGQAQSLTVPRHRELDRGTLQALFRQACRFIPEAELRRWFFAD